MAKCTGTMTGTTTEYQRGVRLTCNKCGSVSSFYDSSVPPGRYTEPCDHYLCDECGKPGLCDCGSSSFLSKAEADKQNAIDAAWRKQRRKSWVDLGNGTGYYK